MSEDYVFVRVRQGLTTGLLGKYFKWEGEEPPEIFKDENLLLTRVDEEINFVWWDKPADNVPEEYFCVEWSGLLKVPIEGRYRFYLVSDDGSKLWVDGELIIDAWKDQAPTVYHSDLFELSAGYHDILLKFYNRHAFAVIQLGWIRPDGISQIIPSENLMCKLEDTIEVEGLKPGFKVEVWSGKKLLEGVADNEGRAVIDSSKLQRPIDAYLKIYDDKLRLVIESPVIRDLWGGDKFHIAKKA